MASSVPYIYRIYFTIFDPLMAASGAYMCLFAPFAILNADPPPAAIDTTYQPIFQQLAGTMLATGLLSAVLPHATNYDLRVWRILAGSLLTVDAGCLWGIISRLGLQGRLSPAGWGGEQWVPVLIAGSTMALRACFVAGLGLAQGKGSKVA